MTTLEQVIETAKALPPADRQYLQQWLRVQERQDAPRPTTEAIPPRAAETVEQQVARFRKAMTWIADHRAEYLGQWVALEGDRLISHGADAIQVHREAKAAGIAAPFIERIVEEEGPYWGGWL